MRDPRCPDERNDPGACAYRRGLLPTWITLCSTVFLIFLLTPLFSLWIGLTNPDSYSCVAFGLRYSGSPLAPEALVIGAVLFLQGFAAYGLLWGRSWGLAGGIVAGTCGLTISLGTAACTAADLGPEPFLQVAFLVSLFRRSDRWTNPSGNTLQSPPCLS